MCSRWNLSLLLCSSSTSHSFSLPLHQINSERIHNPWKRNSNFPTQLSPENPWNSTSSSSMDPNTRLDHALFQLTPTRTRYYKSNNTTTKNSIHSFSMIFTFPTLCSIFPHAKDAICWYSLVACARSWRLDCWILSFRISVSPRIRSPREATRSLSVQILSTLPGSLDPRWKGKIDEFFSLEFSFLA